MITENGRQLALLASATQVHWKKVLDKTAPAPKPIEKILRIEVNGSANESSPYKFENCIKYFSKVCFNGEEMSVSDIPLGVQGVIEFYDAIALDVYDQTTYNFSHKNILGMVSFSGNFDTKNTVSMKSMFTLSGVCEVIDLAKFNIANCKDLSGMFANSGVKYLNLSKFDLSNSNVENIDGMLAQTVQMKELNMKNFNFSKKGLRGTTSFYFQSPYQSTVDLSGDKITKEDVVILANEMNKNIFDQAGKMTTIIVSDPSKHEGLSYDYVTFAYK